MTSQQRHHAGGASVRRSRARWRADQGSLPFRVVSSGPLSTGDRAPVVLIHGIGMSHRYFSRLHDELAREHRVYSIDLPGHGGLPTPDGDMDIATAARGLSHVVASFGTGPVVLVGHSMGTQWAVELASQRPDLVALLVVIGPVTDAEHRSVLAQMRALALDTLVEPPGTNMVVLTDYVRCGPRWYLTQLRHMLAYRIEDRLPFLTMPLLIIRGSRDPIAVQRWCRRLRDRRRGAHLVTIPRHPHVVQQSAPRAVASAIRAFTR